MDKRTNLILDLLKSKKWYNNKYIYFRLLSNKRLELNLNSFICSICESNNFFNIKIFDVLTDDKIKEYMIYLMEIMIEPYTKFNLDIVQINYTKVLYIENKRIIFTGDFVIENSGIIKSNFHKLIYDKKNIYN